MDKRKAIYLMGRQNKPKCRTLLGCLRALKLPPSEYYQICQAAFLFIHIGAVDVFHVDRPTPKRLYNGSSHFLFISSSGGLLRTQAAPRIAIIKAYTLSIYRKCVHPKHRGQSVLRLSPPSPSLE